MYIILGICNGQWRLQHCCLQRQLKYYMFDEQESNNRTLKITYSGVFFSLECGLDLDIVLVLIKSIGAGVTDNIAKGEEFLKVCKKNLLDGDNSI